MTDSTTSDSTPTRIEGTTESELLFFLALTFGLDEDPLPALERMVRGPQGTPRPRSPSRPAWAPPGRVPESRSASSLRWSPTSASTQASTTRPMQSPERLAALRWRRWPSPQWGARGAARLANGTARASGQSRESCEDASHEPSGSSSGRSVPFQEGDCLTDRRRLYRVLEVVPAKFRKRAAILEDCRTLDATLFLPRELKRMRLQLVQRAHAASMQ
jgi:hypothetical protein